MPIVVPLVYPGRQERITVEEVQNNVSRDFFRDHPDEILFDEVQGSLLNRLMFQCNDYYENLRKLAADYQSVEDDFKKHLDGKRTVRTIGGEPVDIDLRDATFQLGLNNRMQTGLLNQFYTTGGAGPFDEILFRARLHEKIRTDNDAIGYVFGIAKRMIQDQKIIFSNVPGVFSYNPRKHYRDNEINTPPFIHPPKKDYTELPGRGIYLMMTGIDGIRENGMYDAATDFGMSLFVPKFMLKRLPQSVQEKAIVLAPNKINNPNVVAQYARAGWSSIWLSHLSETAFITPPYTQNDDPEMFFNHQGIERLGLGVVLKDKKDIKSALEKAVELSETVGDYNQQLVDRFGTLDGIRYAAEKVVDYLEGFK